MGLCKKNTRILHEVGRVESRVVGVLPDHLSAISVNIRSEISFEF